MGTTEPHLQDATAAFEEERGRLLALATRMLGTRADAEDAVQEAWLRLQRQDRDTIDNVRGWLTTVVSRICLDVLRTRKSRPETSYGDEDAPLRLHVTDDAPTPEDDAVLADAVGAAMTVVLDTLLPPERLALVLHDVFAVPYVEIARILDRSPDATKMLASRARRKVRGAAPAVAERRRQREVVDAFLAAARSGDFEALLRVLHPDVTWRIETARGVILKEGADAVVEKARRAVTHVEAVAHPVRVNGEAGIVVWRPSGRPVSVMACTVAEGRIVAMRSVTDPERLAAVDLPGSPTTRGHR